MYWISTALPHGTIHAFDSLLRIPIIIVGAVTAAGFGFVIGCIRAWAYNPSANNSSSQNTDIEDIEGG